MPPLMTYHLILPGERFFAAREVTKVPLSVAVDSFDMSRDIRLSAKSDPTTRNRAYSASSIATLGEYIDHFVQAMVRVDAHDHG